MAAQIGFFDVLKMIFILVVILICTYYVTKLLASKASGVSSPGTKKFFSVGNAPLGDRKLPTVIHRMMIDRDSRFVVIEYNNCDYLIAMTNGAIKVIEKRELSEEEIEQRAKSQKSQEENSFNFSKYLEKIKESQSNKGVDRD